MKPRLENSDRDAEDNANRQWNNYEEGTFRQVVQPEGTFESQTVYIVQTVKSTG